MKKDGKGQKVVKITVILLLIAALLLIVVSCFTIGLSQMPAASDKNPFSTEATQKEMNVFEQFWYNVKSVFVKDGAKQGAVPVDESAAPLVTGDTPDNAEKTDGNESDTFSRKPGYYNFLLIGKDKGGGNTDVMMVLSFDTKNDKIAILQIPRDTYLNVPYSFKKANSVYAAGSRAASAQGKNAEEQKKAGVEALESAILTNLGVVIDRYVFVDISGFRGIVDAVGGVDIYIQKDMNYDDPYQNLHIHLKAGQNHLDGEKAEQFVRFRSGYANADIGRMDAQKIFMSAFLKKLFSVSSITKIPELASQVIKYVDTDISLSDAVIFGKQLLEVDMADITMHSLQGEALYYNGVAYFSLYENANLDLVNRYFNSFDKELTAENVDPKMLTAEPKDSTYEGGSSAQDIDENNPKLTFRR